MEIKEITKNVLDTVGLLDHVKSLRSAVQVRQTDRYLEQLVALYRNPRSQIGNGLAEAWTERRRLAQTEAIRRRVTDDRVHLIAGLLTFLPTQTGSNVDDALAAVTQHRARPSTPPVDAAAGVAQSVVEALAVLTEGPSGKDSPRSLLQRALDAKQGGASAVPDAGQGSSGTSRVALARLVLDRICAGEVFPHSYDYDYLEDIVPIVRSRYVDWSGADVDASRMLLRVLSVLATGDPQLDPSLLTARLQSLLGPDHGYGPVKVEPHPYVRQVIPDLYDELLKLRAREQPARLLEISRDYSVRQRESFGPWGPPLSLLMGYEQDHHLMLRHLAQWTADGRLGPDDEVLVIGPRHRDEMHFFRERLGLPKTIGLDLFDEPEEGIEAGDLHAMKYASGRFKLVYTCSTLCYSYDLRKAMSEILRVLARPGYVIISDAAGRRRGMDVLGRTDTISAEAIVGSFYDARFSVLFHDDGRTPSDSQFKLWPSVGLRVD